MKNLVLIYGSIFPLEVEMLQSCDPYSFHDVEWKGLKWEKVRVLLDVSFVHVVKPWEMAQHVNNFVLIYGSIFPLKVEMLQCHDLNDFHD